MNIGFIDYYLDEWHANNYPRMLREASGGRMQVTHAFALIDSPLGGLTTDIWCSRMGIQRCATIEELVECCDGLIVLSPDNCEMHEQLCQIPLASGKPAYVDKTFAPDGQTARRIFAIANAHGTPCYSSSALRFALEYQPLAQRDVFAVNSWGPNGYATYAIHQLEPIMMLIKAQPRRVMAQTTRGYDQLLIEFEGGRVASLATMAGNSPFALSALTDDGLHQVQVQSDSFARFIEAMTVFFETRAPQVPQQETIAIMDAYGAGLIALKRPGEWIDI